MKIERKSLLRSSCFIWQPDEGDVGFYWLELWLVAQLLHERLRLLNVFWSLHESSTGGRIASASKRKHGWLPSNRSSPFKSTDPTEPEDPLRVCVLTASIRRNTECRDKAFCLVKVSTCMVMQSKKRDKLSTLQRRCRFLLSHRMCCAGIPDDQWLWILISWTRSLIVCTVDYALARFIMLIQGAY